MGWMVEVVQEVTDLPLALDTMNPKAMESGLKVAKNKVLVNSASNRTDSKAEMLPLAVTYNCDIVLSVITDSGCPGDYDGRVESILEGHLGSSTSTYYFFNSRRTKPTHPLSTIAIFNFRDVSYGTLLLHPTTLAFNFLHLFNGSNPTTR